MRLLLSGFLFLSFLSVSQAQDVLKCSLSIKSNKTKRDLKQLRNSSIERSIELVAGESFNEEIKINRIIAYPGEKKTDKYLIRLFSEDKREGKIAEEKNIKLVRMDAKERIRVNISHDGYKTIAKFSSNSGSYTLRIHGVGGTSQKTFYLYSHYNFLKKEEIHSRLDPIIISCKMMPAESILEDDIKNYGNDSLNEEARIKSINTAKSE